MPAHRACPQRRLIGGGVVVRHWYWDRSGFLVRGMSAVVGGATVRVAQQGVGFHNLSKPFVGSSIRFPEPSVGMVVAEVAAVGVRDLGLSRSRRQA